MKTISEAPVSYLLSLSTELQVQIAQYLRDAVTMRHDLYSWSSTSSHFRSLLTPYLFSSATLTNTEKSGSSIDLLAKSNFARYIRKFSFVGTAPGEMEEGFSDTAGILPEIVESVISDLNRFPNLETVHIEFDIDFDNEWDETFLIFDEAETPDARLKAEQEEAWRALITKVYAALAKNTSPVFKKLELEALIPAEASSFSTLEFQRLLSHMTHFRLSCWGGNDSHYGANTQYGYVHFTQRYGELFFNHLSSVTHLSIEASGSATIHMTRFGPATQMPLLENLTLEEVFIGPGLNAFLTSHAHTLKSIHLQDCHSDSESEFQGVSVGWKDLFKALSQQNPSKLREFRVLPDAEFELFSNYHATQEERDDAALALEILKTHPERRLFSYSYIDDKYGFCGDVQSANLESFQRGDDQRSYDDLMHIVKSNGA